MSVNDPQGNFDNVVFPFLTTQMKTKKTTECWLTSNSHKAKSLKKTIKLYLSETSLRQSCNIVKYPQCTCWQLWKPYEKSISVTRTNSTVRWTAIRQAGWPSAGMKCYITILKTILERNTAVYRQLCNSNFIIFSVKNQFMPYFAFYLV